MPMPSLFRPLVRAAARAGGALAPLAGGPVELDGGRLDPELQAVLAGARALRAGGLETMTPARARAYAAATLGVFDVAPRPMAQVIDAAAPGPAGPVPVRVYVPHGATPAMLVFFHGGGGVIGSIDSYDASCRLVADRAGCRVASVGYRLAPEHPHPAALDDALAAYRWAAQAAPRLGVAPHRLALGGDSFGGFLAAWTERRAAAAGLPRPAATWLVYPLLDLTASLPSHATFADGFVLTGALIRWFRDHYHPDVPSRRADSPLWAADVAGAAPSIVVTAGFDPLRDEGAAWADRLAAAGAPVTYRCETDLVHGFLGMAGALRRPAAAVAALCADLAAALAG